MRKLTKLNWSFNNKISFEGKPDESRKNRYVKFTLKIVGHKFYPIWLYVYTTLCIIRSKKKTKTKIQVKDIKPRLFKNLFLRFKLKYLCFGLLSKIPLTAVQIIQICKWKQNVWQKTCHIHLNLNISRTKKW